MTLLGDGARAGAETTLGPVPFFKPDLGPQENDAVREVMATGWLTTGARCREFEQRFAAAVDAQHAVAVNSCTAALHLALAALDIGPGDEVIVPTMTFAATAEVVLYTGAEPVLVDVHPDTLCIDVDAVAAAVTDRTRAVVPVHYGGQAAPMDELAEVVQRAEASRAGRGIHRRIDLIEDAAHAFPSRYRDRTIGSIGTATCFSFYANKTITTGEGGMLTTADESLADRVRRLSLHGLDRSAWRRWETRASWDYDIVEAGYKYNLSDLAAAIGIAQLARAEELATARRRLAARYTVNLERFDAIEPLIVAEPDDSSWHLFVVKVPDGPTRTRVIEHLKAHDVGTSVHYKPLHRHPLYEQRFRGPFPAADDAFDRIVSLPLFPSMTDAEVDYVSRLVAEVVSGRSDRVLAPGNEVPVDIAVVR